MSLMRREFEIKDLSPLYYFLSIEVQPISNDLHCPHTKYALDLLKRTNMLDYKPCITPIAPRI